MLELLVVQVLVRLAEMAEAEVEVAEEMANVVS